MQSDRVSECYFATNDREAWDYIHKYRVRCVVSDVKLVSTDGTDFLSAVARLQPDARRVIITGENSPEIIQRAVSEAKVERVFYKPLQPDEVLTGIEELIETSSLVVEEPLMTVDMSVVQFKDWYLSDIAYDHESEIVELAEDGRSETILVVEDVQDMREMIRDRLHERGYRTIAAKDGDQALEQLRSHPIDLVITDWMMPRKTGPQLLAAMREEPALAGIPTVLLTAKGDDISKVVAAQNGASAYLAKPFDLVELSSTVANLLRLKEGERKIHELNRNLTENILSRFIPAPLIESLQSEGGVEALKQARMEHVTILFADICNFTRLSEELGPQQMALVLNRYFAEMTDVIFEHSGTIDKFIGDAVMVIFGAPIRIDLSEQAVKAARCALAMQKRLAELSDAWQQEGLPSLEIRIGLHQGPAIVGMFGGERRAEYTAIGPTVNMAARVERCAEAGTTLLTAVVRDYLDGFQWTKAGLYELRGIAGEVTLFRLLSEPDETQAAS